MMYGRIVPDMHGHFLILNQILSLVVVVVVVVVVKSIPQTTQSHMGKKIGQSSKFVSIKSLKIVLNGMLEFSYQLFCLFSSEERDLQ